MLTSNQVKCELIAQDHASKERIVQQAHRAQWTKYYDRKSSDLEDGSYEAAVLVSWSSPVPLEHRPRT